jgi:hypothetical protein
MKKFFYIFSLLFILGACSTLKVSYDYDRKANFNLYKTFAFEEEKLEKLQMNNLDKRRIVEQITNHLLSKGFLENKTDPDLYITISNTTKDKLDTYYYDNWPMWGRWGPWWGFNGGTRAYTYQYTEGIIIIDIIDAKKNLLLFQGRGSGMDVENLNSKKEVIDKLINKILAKYPPSIFSNKKIK